MSSDSNMIPSIASAPSDVKKDKNLFALYALKAALLFMILSLFPMYKLTDKLAEYAGQHTLGLDGFPSLPGIALHGFVFFLISYGLMVASKRSKVTLTTTLSVLAAIVVLIALVDVYRIRA
jgi:hypothetical protein